MLAEEHALRAACFQRARRMARNLGVILLTDLAVRESLRRADENSFS